MHVQAYDKLDSGSAACPLCDSDSQLSFVKLGYFYYRCTCNFVFIWPRPSREELRDLYIRHGDDYWTSKSMVEFAFSPTKSSREVNFVRQHASYGDLLDIGCSTGSFVKAALSSGFKAEGCDISQPAVRLGQTMGLPLFVADILSEDIQKQYDVVTMWATLEHLPDPKEYLLRASRLLKPGGLLFVSVPNYSSLTQAILGKWDRYVGNEHLNYFTPPVLKRAIEACGFSFLGRTTFGFNPLIFLKDLLNRGEKLIDCAQVQADSVSTLNLKRSGLVHMQRGVEKVLNLWSGGDVVAVAAVKSSISPIADGS